MDPVHYCILDCSIVMIINKSAVCGSNTHSFCKSFSNRKSGTRKLKHKYNLESTNCSGFYWKILKLVKV